MMCLSSCWWTMLTSGRLLEKCDGTRSLTVRFLSLTVRCLSGTVRSLSGTVRRLKPSVVGLEPSVVLNRLPSVWNPPFSMWNHPLSGTIRRLSGTIHRLEPSVVWLDPSIISLERSPPRTLTGTVDRVPVPQLATMGGAAAQWQHRVPASLRWGARCIVSSQSD